MSDGDVYRLWENGKNRFAVTLGPQPVPVVGFVSQNADRTWIAECKGEILRPRYASADAAARELVRLTGRKVE
jgi:hypothetical protein